MRYITLSIQFQGTHSCNLDKAVSLYESGELIPDNGDMSLNIEAHNGMVYVELLVKEWAEDGYYWASMKTARFTPQDLPRCAYALGLSTHRHPEAPVHSGGE